MKELNFKTSKGEFILLDGDADGRIKLPTNIEYQELGRVKYMTEEQFVEVVKCSWEHNLKQYSRFTNYLNNDNSYYGSFPTAKESFESLISSLGWYLWENPIKLPHSMSYCCSRWSYYGHEVLQWRQAESKTLYNPILLKK